MNRYEQLNDFLNQYSLSRANTFFHQNIQGIMALSQAIVEIEESEQQKQKEGKKEFTYIPLLQSYALAKEFLERINPGYVEILEQFITDGTIDIDMEQEKEYRNNAGRKEGKPYINLRISHTLNDVCIFIHEFMHMMNEKYCRIETRENLTEFISIYMENLVYDFLVEKGYEEEEIQVFRRERIKDTIRCAKGILKYAPYFLAFEYNGNITENTYEETKKWELWESKEEFEKGIDSFNQILKSTEAKEEFWPKKIQEYYSLSEYVMGTLLMPYMKQMPDKGLKEMMYLNENIGKYTTFDALATIGIDLDQKGITESLIKTYKEYVKKDEKKLKEK